MAQYSKRVRFNPSKRNPMMLNYEGLYPHNREVEKILSDVDSDHHCRWRNGPDGAARG